MTAAVTTHWWESHTELARLYRWLDERAESPDPVEFMEKPWKWEPEYEHMMREQSRGVVRP